MWAKDRAGVAKETPAAATPQLDEFEIQHQLTEQLKLRFRPGCPPATQFEIPAAFCTGRPGRKSTKFPDSI